MNSSMYSESKAVCPRRAESNAARRPFRQAQGPEPVEGDASPYLLTAAGPRKGFTLIELIGVLAIMAIMATVLVPNVMRSVDRASVVAEQQTAANLGAQLKVYVRNNTVPPAFPAAPAATPVYPAIPAWSSSIGAFTDLSPLDIAYNKRLQARAYLTDPAVPSVRVMIVSSMKTGLALPAQAAMSAVAFQQIWQTSDGSVPPVGSWAGWAAWSPQNAADYLIVQRIDLHTQLQPVTINLNNADVTPVAGNPSYQLLTPAGAVRAAGVVLKAGPPVPLASTPRDTLNLYDKAGALLFTMIVGSIDQTCTFNGTNWVPQ